MIDTVALDALAAPTRRAILERLRAGPQPVVELARGLPVSRPAVSQHLKVLKAAGLVTDRRAGTRRIYAVNPEGIAGLRTYIESLWTAALAGLKAAVETDTTRPTQKRGKRR
jgi:DNA-binding transcriptional ArsR family regulator